MRHAVATTYLSRIKEGLAHPVAPARSRCGNHEEGGCERIAKKGNIPIKIGEASVSPILCFYAEMLRDREAHGCLCTMIVQKGGCLWLRLPIQSTGMPSSRII